MTKRKRKKKIASLTSKKPIDPVLLKARNLRASLLRRVSVELKETTPFTKDLEKWLRLPNHMCFYCLKVLSLEEVQIDHKIPVIRNGDNKISNLCTSCAICNLVKGRMTESEFRQLIEITKSWEDKGESLFMRLRQGNNIFRKR